MPSPSSSWSIAGLAALTLGFSRGLHNSFGVFYVALLDTFQWSRGSTAGVYSLVLFVDALVSPLVGHLLDRYGPKRIVSAGCLLMVLGLFLSSRIETLWQFYLFFGLFLALGFSFTGMVPHVVLTSEWFTTRRASALGVVYSAIGVGIMLLVPFSQWLISTWGWPRAFQTIGFIVLITIFPLVLIFYRQGPGAHPGKSASEPGNAWSAGLALKSLQFWLLFLTRITATASVLVITTHQIAHVADIGYSRIFAATIFGLMGITSTFGRLTFGFIADRISKQATYTVNVIFTLVGIGALMAARDPSQPWLLYVYLIFFGIGFGSRAVILSALSADIFSGRGFGAIYGFLAMSVGVGGAIGAWAGGALHDLWGSYLIPFGMSALILVFSDICVWLVSLKRVRAFDQRLWPKPQGDSGLTRHR